MAVVGELQYFREQISQYKSNKGRPTNVLPFGIFGVGKSSFIRTLGQALPGTSFNPSVVKIGEHGQRGSDNFTKYSLVPGELNIFDPWGWETGGGKYDKGQFEMMCQATATIGTKINAPAPKYNDLKQDKRHLIDLILFFVSIEAVNDNQHHEILRKFIESSQEQGIPCALVLTRVDFIVPNYESFKGITELALNPVVKEHVMLLKKTFSNLEVYPVINTNSINSSTTDFISRVSVLNALKESLNLVIESSEPIQLEKLDFFANEPVVKVTVRHT